MGPELIKLAGYPRLRELSLHNWHPKRVIVPDAFGELAQLERLRVSHSRWATPQARARLRELLPDCRVEFG